MVLVKLTPDSFNWVAWINIKILPCVSGIVAFIKRGIKCERTLANDAIMHALAIISSLSLNLIKNING
jgi:hypothetical protein